MYKIIKDVASVDDVYTIRGRAIGTPTDIRYIQRSWWTNRPVVNTRIAYSYYKLIVFENKIDAENFLTRFVNSKNRKTKYDIEWEVVKYKGSNAKNLMVTLKELEDPEYGKYCTSYRVERLVGYPR